MLYDEGQHQITGILHISGISFASVKTCVSSVCVCLLCVFECVLPHQPPLPLPRAICTANQHGSCQSSSSWHRSMTSEIPGLEKMPCHHQIKPGGSLLAETLHPSYTLHWLCGIREESDGRLMGKTDTWYIMYCVSPKWPLANRHI